VNLLDLVPSFKRQLRQWVREQDTDSTLAAYLADAIEALNWRWVRDYVVTVTTPNTFNVTPEIAMRDKRAIILMASIIYKMGNVELASFRDGDFAWNPQQGRSNPIIQDISELDKMLPVIPQLASARSMPLHGFCNVFNLESPYWGALFGVPGQIVTS
jgi:hypothetical protein